MNKRQKHAGGEKAGKPKDTDPANTKEGRAPPFNSVNCEVLFSCNPSLSVCYNVISSHCHYFCMLNCHFWADHSLNGIIAMAAGGRRVITRFVQQPFKIPTVPLESNSINLLCGQ